MHASSTRRLARSCRGGQLRRNRNALASPGFRTATTPLLPLASMQPTGDRFDTRTTYCEHLSIDPRPCHRHDGSQTECTGRPPSQQFRATPATHPQTCHAMIALTRPYRTNSVDLGPSSRFAGSDRPRERNENFRSDAVDQNHAWSTSYSLGVRPVASQPAERERYSESDSRVRCADSSPKSTAQTQAFHGLLREPIWPGDM